MSASEMLAQIKEGMAVLDSAGQRIGTVEEVYFGTGSDEVEAYTDDRGGGGSSDMEPDVADTYAPGPDLPDVLRRRLLRHGYIRIDTGILENHFATADQVAGVSNDTVRLSVPHDELVH